jgi:lipoprotein-anchoring transpeptidase ErfK/SrfK
MERTEPVLRASWIATVLASVLAVATPVTADLAGTRAAGPAPEPAAVVAPQISAHHDHLGDAPELRTRVLAAHGSSAPSVGPDSRTRAADSAEPKPVDVDVEAKATVVPVAPRPSRDPHLVIHIPLGGMTARRNPWSAAPAVGTVVGSSRYYHVPTVAWVEETNRKGTWGRVELPYRWPRRDGWIPLAGLQRETTWVSVKVDVSDHRVTVWKMGRVLLRTAGPTGAASSPTPPGEYFVTDRVPFSPGSALGSFAFGISGIQPSLPAGWSGGDQLAIHGTNAPWSIGTSASAGCVRVSEATLDRLKPLLRLGTPVVIVP